MKCLGVLINELGGNSESVAAYTAALGKTIRTLSCHDPLLFTFDDGTGLKISDEGQSCCENRYMNCDDNLEDFVGAKFLGAELSDGGSSGDMDEKECLFLKVHTDKGDFTVANYNEHNGYYGGFSITCRAQ